MRREPRRLFKPGRQPGSAHRPGFVAGAASILLVVAIASIGVGEEQPEATSAVQRPKMMLLVDPGPSYAGPDSRAAFEALAAFLEGGKTELVNPSFDAQLFGEAHWLARAVPPAVAACKVGLRVGAELVVVFSCETEVRPSDQDGEEQPPQFDVKATVAGNVYEVTTSRPLRGRIVRRFEAGGPQEEAAKREAIASAARLFSEDVADAVSAWLDRRELRGELFLVRLRGIRDYFEVMAFRRAIESDSAFGNVNQRTVRVIKGKQQSNYAELSISFKGAVAQLQQRLLNVLRRCSGFEGVVAGSARGRLVEIILRPGPDKD